MTKGHHSIQPIGLVIICALGSSILLVGWRLSIPIDRQPINPRLDGRETNRLLPQASIPIERQLGPFEGYRVLVDRPLFAKHRRGPQAIPEAVVPSPPPVAGVAAPIIEPTFLPTGIMMRAHSARALLVSANPPETAWVGVHDHFQGWRILSIGVDQVVVGRDNMQRTLVMPIVK